MEERSLGGTGLIVTPLGLGLAALGRPAYIDLARERDLGSERDVGAMQGRTHDVLDAAWDLGIRYVDAARSYGEAETFLASWLDARGVRSEDLTIGSKWGYRYVGGWRMDADDQEVKDHSVGALRRQYGESREHLGGHLDLYQIHSATLESGVLEDRAVLEELLRLRQEDGLVVGLSVSGPRQGEVVRRALEVEVDGVAPFQTIQATWNLLELSAGGALAEAHDAGWGVIVKEAVANGRLTANSAAQEDPRLGVIAAGHDASLDQMAIAVVLAQRWVDVVLSGAVTSAQLSSNIGAIDIELSDEDLAGMSSFAEAPETYWRTRGDLAWS